MADRWSPHYSVSHVTSPHVMGNAEARETWRYFHGEDTTTRLARSKDGIHFTYDRTVLTTSMLPAGTTGTSYARGLFAPPGRPRQPVPDGVHGQRHQRPALHRLGLVRRRRNRTYSQEPLARPQQVGAVDLSGPHLPHRDDSTYVVYHTDKGSGGNILITEVGNGFDRRNHLGVFHRPMAGGSDDGRSAAPSFGTDRGVEYMVYEAGERLTGSIAVARARRPGTGPGGCRPGRTAPTGGGAQGARYLANWCRVAWAKASRRSSRSSCHRYWERR